MLIDFSQSAFPGLSFNSRACLVKCRASACVCVRLRAPASIYQPSRKTFQPQKLCTARAQQSPDFAFLRGTD